MRNLIRDIIENCFDKREFQNALESKIIDRLDYDDIADSVLDEYDIAAIAVEVAEDQTF